MVVVIRREKRSRLPPILGWMDTCRFCEERKSFLILFSFAFHCMESHMLMIRSLASKWQWCLLKQLSDELFHMNCVNIVQSPWDNFVVAKSGPSAQQKLPCGRKVDSWSKSGSLAAALIFPVVENNEQLRNVSWTKVILVEVVLISTSLQLLYDYFLIVHFKCSTRNRPK